MVDLFMLASLALKQWKWILIAGLLFLVVACSLWIKSLRSDLSQARASISTLESRVDAEIKTKEVVASALRTQVDECNATKAQFSIKRKELSAVRPKQPSTIGGDGGQIANRYSGYVDFYNRNFATDK